jgi:hypothetical protein
MHNLKEKLMYHLNNSDDWLYKANIDGGFWDNLDLQLMIYNIENRYADTAILRSVCYSRGVIHDWPGWDIDENLEFVDHEGVVEELSTHEFMRYLKFVQMIEEVKNAS